MAESTPPSVSSTLEYYRPLPPVGGRVRRSHATGLHVLLLLATCFTTLVMGARMQYNFEHTGQRCRSRDEPIVDRSGQRELISFFPAEWARTHPARLMGGCPSWRP